MKRKKFIPVILAVIMLAQCVIMSASAATSTSGLDKRYWNIQAEFNTATEKKDYRGIIKAAQKTYDLFVGSKDPEAAAKEFEKNGDLEASILATYLLEAAKAAEILEDYGEMVRLYKLFLPFGNVYMTTRLNAAQKLDYETFTINPINNKLKAYNITPLFFTELPPDNSTNPYTGAKFEPRNGIYYGTANPYAMGPLKGNPLTASNSKTSSGTLVYVMFKQENMRDFDWVLQELQKKSDIIEIAWNLDYNYLNLNNAAKETKLIEDTANYLAGLGSPVLLRVAAEMNVWNPPAKPEEFKKFFITVADIMHAKAKNVAIVFSPTAVSALGVTIMDYYPGDKYVDWVGVSNYYQYYFLGKKDASITERSTYMTAEFASPILKLEEIVRLFGGKKPVMISEYGIANYSNTVKESSVAWAYYRLKQLQYYVPMIYPEIKAMFYFDVDRERSGEPNNYALHNTPAMNELYNKIMRENGIYLSLGKPASDFIYAKLDSGGRTVKASDVIINTYAEVMHCPDLSVIYSIGGKEYAKSTEIPYRAVLNFANSADGTYNIDVEVKTAKDNKSQAKKTVTAVKKGEFVTLYDKTTASSGGNRTPSPIAVVTSAGPPKTGDYLGDVLYSDITAQINGYTIPTSVIKGKTLVVVEDLANYGFDVLWSGGDRSLKVTLNKNKEITPLPVEKNTKPVGTFKEKYLMTDIKTYLSGDLVESFAVAGRTLIDFEFLSKYGTLGWNPQTKLLRLWLE